MNQKLKEFSEVLKDSSKQDVELKGIITQIHIAYYNDDLEAFNTAMTKIKSLTAQKVNHINQLTLQKELINEKKHCQP